MDSILIVSSTDKGKELLTGLLQANGYSQIAMASSGEEVRKLITDQSYGIIIIIAPLVDEFGHELAKMITETATSGVILIVKTEIADIISAKVEDYGVFVIAKTMSKPLFKHALKLVTASQRMIFGLKNENVKLQQKIEDIKLIDRAKCVLIQYLNISEPQAHKYIEKQAMDLRLTRREVAEGILKTYES